MALLFADGFEDGTSAWTLTQMSNTAARFGNGLVVTGGSGAAEAGFAPTAGPIIAGFAYKPASASQYAIAAFFNPASGYPQVGLRRDTGGQISVIRTTTVLGTTAASVLPAGAWSYIEVKATINDTTGIVIVRVNGVEVLNLTNQDTKDSSPTTTGTFKLANFGVESSQAGNAFDDVYICDATGSYNNDFLGELTVEHLRPASDDTNQWVGSDSNSVNNWDLVDEAGAAGTSDYVQSSTVGQRDLYVPVPSARGTGTAVYGVVVAAVAQKTDVGTRNVKLAVKESVYGAAQRPTIAGTPNSNGTGEGGARFTFTQLGRVTGIRYQRHVGGSLTPSFRAWDSVGTKVIDIADTQTNIAGFGTVTFPTPLTVAAGSTYTFSISGTNVSVGTGQPASVTNTADVTFVAMRSNGTVGVWPNTADPTTSYFVEPIYEPFGVLRQSTELGLPTSFGELRAVWDRKGDGTQFTIADVNALRFGYEVSA